MRNNSYDGLSRSILSLKMKMNDHQLSIEKADIHNENSLQACVSAFEDVNAICKSINEQFTALQNDFYKGTITQARYKPYLMELKDLLVDREKPLKNANLNLQEMIGEIRRFG